MWCVTSVLVVSGIKRLGTSSTSWPVLDVWFIPWSVDRFKAAFARSNGNSPPLPKPLPSENQSFRSGSSGSHPFWISGPLLPGELRVWPLRGCVVMGGCTQNGGTLILLPDISSSLYCLTNDYFFTVHAFDWWTQILHWSTHPMKALISQPCVTSQSNEKCKNLLFQEHEIKNFLRNYFTD